MRLFEAADHTHRPRALNAYEQFHLLRAVAPILPAALALDLGTAAVDAESIANVLGGVEPEAVTVAFEAAAGASERLEDGVWVTATKAGVPLSDMLTIVLAVVEAHLGDYFSRKRPDFTPASGRRQEFDPVSMPDGESWFWRPCAANRIPMIGATDGIHRLWHFGKANDLLDVEAENEHRALKAAERAR